MNDDEKMARILAIKKKKMESGEIKIMTNPIDKWEASNKKSYALMTKAKCAECMGCLEGYLEPGFREQISNCSSLKCPLHSKRPYQKG